ncbi:MAG: bifunctional hydroxymethylpyrimidine kinase/phosphomethylpyrimidine kinase [Myxococcales bacterium]|nr:bifunctional hydroxymethylpyrimidine kinase/phosphomethylpyrimidine kinase [Myxococcales bacterium]
MPVALSIAGSDSGGGAGIQADLKTFAEHRVFGMTAVTAITAQNSQGVRGVWPVPVDGLVDQLQAVFDDFEIAAVKIGMLGSAEHVAAVAQFLADRPQRPPVVLDPVMVASTGHRLLTTDAERVLAEQLLPLAQLATPNLDEASVLAGAEGRQAAEAWAAEQSTAVLITGGDVVGSDIVDTLVQPDQPPRTWRHPRQGDRPFHGTGCTLSSAITAQLALGRPLPQAVDQGIAYVQQRIRVTRATGSVGGGNPSLLHGF